MRKAFAYFAFLVSGLLALWFVASWADSLRRDGLSETVYSMLHWPAVMLTAALPALAIIFLCVGTSLLGSRDSA